MKTVGKILTIILGICMLIGGFYCMFSAAYTYMAIGYVIALMMIFDAVGIFALWGEEKRNGQSDGWMLAGAIMSLVFGILVFSSPHMVAAVDVFLVYFLAIWLVICGIISIVRACKLHKTHKDLDTQLVGVRWYLILILGILQILLGVLCLLNPIIMASIIGVFMGLGIVCTGAGLIAAATTTNTPAQ